MQAENYFERCLQMQIVPITFEAKLVRRSFLLMQSALGFDVSGKDSINAYSSYSVILSFTPP